MACTDRRRWSENGQLRPLRERGIVDRLFGEQTLQQLLAQRQLEDSYQKV